MEISNKNNLSQLLRLNYLATGVMALFLLLSCGGSDPEPNTDPANLSVDVTVVGANASNPNGDGSGLVSVTATASNTVRYGFSFNGGGMIERTSGTVEYTFTQDGVNEHTIDVWAYGESGKFINETVVVSVYHAPEVPEVDEGLIFFDEFNYEGSPDPEKWHHQIIPPNNGGWYNGELQHYTNREENSYVSNGTLKIVASKEAYTTGGSTKSYTSARMNSKFAFTYGRVEFRAKLPSAAGTWPALWTLGANINETGNYYGTQYGNVGWPACGEIDMLEQKGWDKENVLSWFHWGDLTTGQYLNEGGSLAVADTDTQFHIYAMDWDENSIKVYVDDRLVYELPNDANKPYNDPHYLLMNIAVGGNLGGDVPANFTQGVMEIDYVRVYE